jgi:hypothetical protein
MVALVGQWWLERRSPSKEEVATHLVDLAYNGLAHLRPRSPLTASPREPASGGEGGGPLTGSRREPASGGG